MIPLFFRSSDRVKFSYSLIIRWRAVSRVTKITNIHIDRPYFTDNRLQIS